jgi:hypothetical protein
MNKDIIMIMIASSAGGIAGGLVVGGVAGMLTKNSTATILASACGSLVVSYLAIAWVMKK